MGGVDITTVKELLGHKSLTMTLRYSHLAPSHKRMAVSVLEEKLGYLKGANEIPHYNYTTISGYDGNSSSHKSLRDMVGAEGIEPSTPCV